MTTQINEFMTVAEERSMLEGMRAHWHEVAVGVRAAIDEATGIEDLRRLEDCLDVALDEWNDAVDALELLERRPAPAPDGEPF